MFPKIRLIFLNPTFIWVFVKLAKIIGIFDGAVDFTKTHCPVDFISVFASMDGRAQKSLFILYDTVTQKRSICRRKASEKDCR